MGSFQGTPLLCLQGLAAWKFAVVGPVSVQSVAGWVYNGNPGKLASSRGWGFGFRARVQGFT